jgi:glucose/arabinose dehydrogenase
MLPAMLFAHTLTMQPVLAQNATDPITANNTGQNATSSASVDNAGLPFDQSFSTRVLATNFSSPHNILYGPDGALWITERTGENITRIDPESGERLSIMGIVDAYQEGGQDGVMGMAFDPDFTIPITSTLHTLMTQIQERGKIRLTLEQR